MIINEVVELQIAGASATNGRPHPIPRDRDIRVAGAYRRLVRRSSPIASSLCREAAALLSRYAALGVSSDVVVPVAVIDLASRLDAGEPDLHCTQTVIAAMPKTSTSQVAVRNARALCDGSVATMRCVAISH